MSQKNVMSCALFLAVLTISGCASDAGESLDGDVMSRVNDAEEYGDGIQEKKESFSGEAYFGAEAELLSKEEYFNMYDDVFSLMTVRSELQWVIDSGSGSMETLTEINGMKQYILVEYEGVHSWADFELCLAEIYDMEFLKETLIPYCTEGEKPLFTDYEGALYRKMADAVVNMPNLDTLQIYQIKEACYAVVCEVEDDSDEKNFDIWYLRRNSDKTYGYELIGRTLIE